MNARRQDFYTGVGIAALGLFLFFIGIPAGIDLREAGDTASILIRPDFWPRVLAVLMILAGLGFALSVRLADTPKVRTRPAGASEPRLTGAGAIVLIVALMFLAGGKIGILIPSMLAFLVAALALQDGKTIHKLVFAIVVPVTLAIFFEFVANLTIPLGALLDGVLGR